MKTSSPYIVFLCAGAALVACHKKPAAHATAPKVYVQQITAKDVPIYIEFIGTIDADINAEIRARVPGYVEQVAYKEGSTVKKGDLLFKIDPVEQQASVTQSTGEIETAKAGLAKAKADVARLTPLAAQKAVSQQELDHAIAQQQAAQAQVAAMSGSLASARANLSYTTITSPIDGIAGTANVKIGNLVGKTEATLLTTVSKLDQVRVTFTLSEQLYLKHAQALSQFEKLQAENPDRPGKLDLILADGSTYPHKGKLSFVERQVDPTTGSISLVAIFPNPDRILRPGLFAKVRVQREVKAGALLVPQRAVQEIQGVTQLCIVKDHRVEVRRVTMGDRSGSDWVVERGLNSGEQVIIEGIDKVKEGSVVRDEPMPQSAAPQPQPSAEAKP